MSEPCAHERAAGEDTAALTDHGFTWGPMTVERTARLPNGGRLVRVMTGAKGGEVSIYVSEGGRSVRVFKEGRELK